MWTLEPTTEYLERQAEYAERCPASLAYVLAKLGIVQTALNYGGRVQSLRYNFLRSEKKGVFRIGYSGKGNAVLRLYLCFDEESKTIHQLLLGGKNNQQADIRHCHSTADMIRLRNNTTTNGNDKIQERGRNGGGHYSESRVQQGT